MSTLQKKIESGEIRIPSLPKVAAQVIELSGDKDISIKKMVEIIEKSPSMAVELLKLANSPFYRGTKTVKTIQGAITRIGLDLARNSILNISLMDVFKLGKDSSEMQNNVWKESFTTAVCARSLARRIDHENPEEALTAGLVTHVGIMIMLAVLGNEYLELLREKFYHNKDLSVLEREAYQTDHLEVGYTVLSRWNFPETIKEVVKHYRSEEILSSPDERLAELIKIIQVSEKTAILFISENPILNNDIIWLCEQFFDMGQNEVEKFLQHIQEEVNEAASLIGIHQMIEKSSEQIYRSAIEKLAELNLRYDLLNKKIIKLAEERKRAEEARITALKRFADAIEGMIDAVAILDLDGRIHQINSEFEKGSLWKKEEVIGKTIPQLGIMSGEDAQKVEKEIIPELMKQGFVRNFEILAIRKNGTQFPSLMNWTLLRDVEGNPTAIITVARDITEIKQVEEERLKLEMKFQQAQRLEAIGTLAGGIAHNFNNLLMGVQGNTSLMLFDIDDTHPHFEALVNIENQVKNGARLTSQLLGYARKGKYLVNTIDLNRIVEETSDTFSMTMKEITLTRELAEELLAIEADQGQIEQALLNLYVNAADAMPYGGKLILKTMNTTHEEMKDKVYDPKPGKYVLLKVADTGKGMDKETQARIFDPFFTTKEMGRGTGLGLASVYGIVKGHGGYIDVQSEINKGTVFSLYLPATDRKPEKTIEPADDTIKGSGTILLVDDEKIVLDVGVRMLENLGYSVLDAGGGREAVDIYKENSDKIDMVVIDMIMPLMGGGEAYDRMKEINPKVKVLLSSGYSIDGRATEILNRGCDGFIQKPFGLKNLSQKLQEILDKN
jgi:PAS domain S-box-containing protein